VSVDELKKGFAAKQALDSLIGKEKRISLFGSYRYRTEDDSLNCRKYKFAAQVSELFRQIGNQR
jgi:hypothetical protein